MTASYPNATRALHAVIEALTELSDEHGDLEVQAANLVAVELILAPASPEQRARVVAIAADLLELYRQTIARPPAEA